MQVPLLDLKAQYATIEKEIMASVSDVLKSQRCIGGPKVEQLENEIAEISDCKYGVGTSSGTDAILAALMAMDIGAGDEVITTTFTFFATAGCIARTGASPVFVDIDPKTYNIDPALIEKAVTEKTKAILPVHLFGQMADMDAVMAIAKKHNLAVIEDAAQSITSVYKGKKAGSIGNAGCFSFFPSKNLGGIGDGGMIVTNDKDLYEKLIVTRDHGQDPRYYYKFVGGNFRLDPIQAAALSVKLPHLQKWSQARRDNAAFYDEKFKNADMKTPYISEDCVSIYNQYTICVENRDELLKHLQKNDIGCAVYYPLSLHLQKCFAELGFKKGDFPVSEKLTENIMALPVYPELTKEMTQYVAEKVLEFVG